MEEVGERLAEERKRLGKTVAGMAEECGVSKQAQINFEKGRQLPGGAYLIATAALGVDIAYVLTGRRSGTLPPMSMSQSMSMESISESDRALLDSFHAAPTHVQAAVETTLGAFAPVPAIAPSRRRNDTAA